jgi:SAM-dependent methyltransferase
MAVPTSTCPVCSAEARFAFDSPYVPVSQCTNDQCRHLFVAEPPAGAGVQAHVAPDVERRTWSERNRRLVGFLTARGLLFPTCRVLDFGAGAGHLAAAVQEALPAADVLCIEADHDSQRHLEASGLQVVASLDDVDGLFDGAILVEVIEHLTDPVAVLGRLASVLRPGGRLFITTPCGETTRGSRRTRAYETPEHVQFFTEASLQLALRKSGFAPMSFTVINALALREPGLRRLRSELKNVLRPVRAKVLGHPHLAGFCELA